MCKVRSIERSSAWDKPKSEFYISQLVTNINSLS